MKLLDADKNVKAETDRPMESTAREREPANRQPPWAEYTPVERLYRVGEALLIGHLPKASGREVTWSGLGRGVPCDGCGERIDLDDHECEVILSALNARVLHLHGECEQLWRQLSSARPPNP